LEIQQPGKIIHSFLIVFAGKICFYMDGRDIFFTQGFHCRFQQKEGILSTGKSHYDTFE